MTGAAHADTEDQAPEQEKGAVGSARDSSCRQETGQMPLKAAGQPRLRW